MTDKENMPHLVTEFDVGAEVNMSDLSEERAIAIFGEPLYRAWKEIQKNPPVDGLAGVATCPEL
jgi:hypothetical protein